jgi:hypothetical protein
MHQDADAGWDFISKEIIGQTHFVQRYIQDTFITILNLPISGQISFDFPER